jgi:hypothetical protein
MMTNKGKFLPITEVRENSSYKLKTLALKLGIESKVIKNLWAKERIESASVSIEQISELCESPLTSEEEIMY